MPFSDEIPPVEHFVIVVFSMNEEALFQYTRLYDYKSHHFPVLPQGAVRRTWNWRDDEGLGEVLNELWHEVSERTSGHADD